MSDPRNNQDQSQPYGPKLCLSHTYTGDMHWRTSRVSEKGGPVCIPVRAGSCVEGREQLQVFLSGLGFKKTGQVHGQRAPGICFSALQRSD